MTDGIPPTTSVRPRPVWARHIRRCEWGDNLDPPTEEEKHDAILVLEQERTYQDLDRTLRFARQLFDEDNPEALLAHDRLTRTTEALVREAHRIFDEASS